MSETAGDPASPCLEMLHRFAMVCDDPVKPSVEPNADTMLFRASVEAMPQSTQLARIGMSFSSRSLAYLLKLYVLICIVAGSPSVAALAQPYTPLPRGSSDDDYRKAFPIIIGAGHGTWAVDDIGKAGVPLLTNRQVRLAKWALRRTPSCLRWRLQFGFPAIGDGGKQHAFAVFLAGAIYFTTNDYVVYDSSISDVSERLYTVAGSATFPTPAPQPVGAPCDPFGDFSAPAAWGRLKTDHWTPDDWTVANFVFRNLY